MKREISTKQREILYNNINYKINKSLIDKLKKKKEKVAKFGLDRTTAKIKTKL